MGAGDRINAFGGFFISKRACDKVSMRKGELRGGVAVDPKVVVQCLGASLGLGDQQRNFGREGPRGLW